MSSGRCALLLAVVGLLAVGVPLPGTAQAEGQPFVVEDPLGDPFPMMQTPAAPPAGPWPQIDVVALHVGPDDVSSFRLAFTVAGRTDPFTTLTEAAAGLDVYCEARWNFNEHEDVLYLVQFGSRDLLEPPGGDPATPWSALVRRAVTTDGRGAHEAYPDGADVVWDPDLPGYVATIKKVYAKVAPDERPPSLGDTLTGLSAVCRTDLGAAPVLDYVPDGGGVAAGSYLFQDPGPGNVVRVSFPDEERSAEGEGAPDVPGAAVERTLGVAGGELAVLPFRMENLAGSVQTVTISAAAFSADGAPLDWNLTVARNVELRPGELRTANVIVRPPADVAVGDTGSVRIDVVTAQGDPGRAARGFIVVPIFTPEHNRLQFHSRYTPSTGTALDAVADRARSAWGVTMSLLDPLPGWDDGPVPVDVVERSFFFSLPPLARPLLLEAEGVMTLDLAFAGTGMVDVRLTLIEESVGTIFDYQGVVAAGTTTKVERLVLSDGPLVVPGGMEIQGRLVFQQDPANGVTLDAAFDPQASGLTLPVLPDAGTLRVITDGRYVPSVYLEIGEVPEVFVNPGKTYAYALVVANEGAESDEISLSATFDTPGWEHRFVPGERFRIDPGNATAVGIEIVAPAGLAENTKVPITVLATSKFDPLAVARLNLAATVQEGIEVPERRYEEREGALRPVLEVPKDSPAASVVVLVPLLVAAALAWSGRRRR